MALDISVRTREGVTVVDCSGRLVFGDETTELRAKVKELLAENPRVVLNLANVSSIDSGGVGTLVGLYTSSIAVNGQLSLACLTPRVRESLRLTRLLGIFRDYETEEDAIATFRPQGRAVAS